MMVSRTKLESFLQAKETSQLEELGGVEGLAKCIGSDISAGLSDSDLENRRKCYGQNACFRQQRPSLIQLVWNSMKDTITIILLCACVVSVVFSAVICQLDMGILCPTQPIWDNHMQSQEDGEVMECKTWTQGLSLFLFLGLLCCILAGADYFRLRRFCNFLEDRDDFLVKVKRGGNEMYISLLNICVGDVIFLGPTSRVPADGVLIEARDLKVDESFLHKSQETQTLVKSKEGDPFMWSGTIIIQGDAVMLALAVGNDCEWGKKVAAQELERPQSSLQIRLSGLAEKIGKLGLFVAVACFICQLAVWIWNLSRQKCFVPGEDHHLTGHQICDIAESQCTSVYGVDAWVSSFNNFRGSELNQLVDFFVDSTAMVIFAIPIGLPFLVTLSGIRTAEAMHDSLHCVRRLSACEQIGGITSLCVDKTGNLTQNSMTVIQGILGGELFSTLPTPSELGPRYLEILTAGISVNAKAEHRKGLRTSTEEINGDKMGDAMLQFLQRFARNNEHKVKIDVVRSQYLEKLQIFSTLIRTQDSQGRIFVSGPSEVIIWISSSYLDNSGTVVTLNDEKKNLLIRDVSMMSNQQLRPIGIAFCEVANISTVGEFESVLIPACNMTFVGVLGIADPPYKDICDSIKNWRDSGIKVRMMTQDNILTASSFSRAVGILTSGCAIEGSDFRAMTLQDQYQLLENVQVIAKCTPSDKLILTQRLMEMGEVVAVTGNAHEDASAMTAADVGICMGTNGAANCHFAADIAIKGVGLSAITDAVLKGRSIFDNIRKVIQLQLTCIGVALILCLCGTLCGFGQPLKPVQLLWMHLMIGWIGSKALISEPPSTKLLNKKLYAHTGGLITVTMWRNILLQGLWQSMSLLGILFGAVEFGLKDCIPAGHYVESSVACLDVMMDGQGNGNSGNYRNTLVYNAFAFSQIFNTVNARILDDEKNCFKGLARNRALLPHLLAIAVFQFVFVQFCSYAFQTVPLDGTAWAISLLAGLTVIPVGFLIRCLSSTMLDALVKEWRRMGRGPKVVPEEVENRVSARSQGESADRDTRNDGSKMTTSNFNPPGKDTPAEQRIAASDTSYLAINPIA